MKCKKNRLLIFTLLVAIISLCFSINSVYADYNATIINTSPCKLYNDEKGKKATGSCMYKDTTFKTLTPATYYVDNGDKVRVITSKAAVKPPKSGYGSECKSQYLYMGIEYKGQQYYGYVCQDHVWDGKIDNDLKNKFLKAGFPESYVNGLAALQISHPNWKFVAIPTELDFYTALKGESPSGWSLIQVTKTVNSEGYLSTREADFDWKTDKFRVRDGSNWYQANDQTIAYFMDPRNFLSDMYIFQFETLAYLESADNLEVIKTMLTGHYIQKYSSNFLAAGKQEKVNAVYLASLSKQEIGGATANIAITGNEFTYRDGKKYKGYYNFYNIGATSDANAAINGLYFAAGKPVVENGEIVIQTNYHRPWNTPEKAIVGGANFISEKYISHAQSTSYFKKWNVVANYAKKNGLSANSLYSNQYMTNIQAPSSEAVSVYNSYAKLNKLNESYTFFIPVYNNMPASTSLPKKGNPNSYLANITISKNGGIASTINSFSGDKFKYEIHVDSSVSKVKLSASTINKYASVSGTGEKTLAVGNNEWKLVVTAENGNKSTYTVNIIKDGGGTTTPSKSVDEIVKESVLNRDGDYVTGLTFNTSISSIISNINKIDSKATITFKKDGKNITSGNITTGMILTITSNGESKSFTAVLYGDINGDGVVNALDLLKVQKHILGVSKLTGYSYKAADTSKDNNVNALDLLKLQKHILGVAFINQG